MEREVSCGAVVFTHCEGERRYVIIRGKKGFFGFPKGHMEMGETEHETALREIWEETGLRVRLIDGFRTEDEHLIPREGKQTAIKRIIYFTAEYDNQELHPQDSEISEVQLMTYEEAMNSFQFESSKRILSEAKEFLDKKQP